MSDLIFYITSIASAFGPITLAAASAAALYIIGPHRTTLGAERELDIVDPQIELSDEEEAAESGAQLID
jgi:hypothetical protein